jgi:hypothetical protein
MKKTSEENIEISDLISDSLGISFRNTEYSLGKWGEVDNWAMLPNDTIVILECEKGQKHPNTNLLKLYPFWEENSDKTIVLIHYFYPKNKAPKNRLALCDFLSDKMEQLFVGRFHYISLRCDANEISEKIWEQKKGFMQQLLTGKIRLNL